MMRPLHGLKSLSGGMLVPKELVPLREPELVGLRLAR